MKKRKLQIVLVAVLLSMLGIWLFPSIAEGQRKDISSWQVPGNGNPQCLKARPFCSKEQRQGYSQSFIIDTNQPLIEVAEGKCYVLLRLYSKAIGGNIPEQFEGSIWTLTIDEQTFLDELSLSNRNFYYLNYIDDRLTLGNPLKEDFPDKCVVVEGGKTLGIIKNEAVEKVSITLIGYFYNTP